MGKTAMHAKAPVRFSGSSGAVCAMTDFLALTSAPALCECSHRSFACRFVTACRASYVAIVAGRLDPLPIFRRAPGPS